MARRGHVALPLKIPEPAGKLLTLRVADPEFFIDFEFADKDPVKLVSAPSGCVVTVAKPKPPCCERQAEADRVVLHQPRAGNQFRVQDGERGHRRLPMMRLAAGDNSRLALVARGFEFAAALAVLAFGLALLASARGAT